MSRRARERGFTLVEAAVAALCLSLVMVAVGGGLATAGRSVREEKRLFTRTSLIASKLAELDGTPVAALLSGADTVRVAGRAYPRSWQITRADGNHDGTPDAGLFLITVTVESDSCQTLRSDIQ